MARQFPLLKYCVHRLGHPKGLGSKTEENGRCEEVGAYYKCKVAPWAWHAFLLQRIILLQDKAV